MKPKDTTAQAAVEKAAEYLMYLYGRWQDESEYEDFAEYVDAMKKRLPEGSTDVTLTKQPFEVRFTDAEGQRRYIKVDSSGAEWGRVGSRPRSLR